MLAPIAVYFCDASGVILDYNHRAAELWGRKPELGDPDERFCGSFKPYRPDAYQLYLKGRYYWNKRTEEAIVVAGFMVERKS